MNKRSNAGSTVCAPGAMLLLILLKLSCVRILSLATKKILISIHCLPSHPPVLLHKLILLLSREHPEVFFGAPVNAKQTRLKGGNCFNVTVSLPGLFILNHGLVEAP